MEQIKWTTKSLKDLKAINDFISLDFKFYAARFINRLIQRANLELYASIQVRCWLTVLCSETRPNAKAENATADCKEQVNK